MLRFFIPLFLFPLILSAQSSLNMGVVGSYNYTNNECSDIWGYVDPSGTEYALVGLLDGLSVVDLSTPSNPIQNFFIPGAQSMWRDIKVWNNYAFVTCDQGSDGLLIVDLNDMTGSTHVYTTIDNNGDNMFSQAHNIYIDEYGKAYIFGGNVGTVGGALILDVTTTDLSNNILPSIIGVFDEFYLHDGMARGDTLWGAAVYQGNFYAIDVSTPSNPIIMNNGAAFHSTPDNFTHNCWISDDGHTLFTTDEVSGAYIGAYDVSDLNNIYETDRIQPNPGSGVIPHNTHVLGDFIVTSYYRDGIRIHDVTYPNNMIEVAYYDAYLGSGNGFDGSWGAYPFLPSGLILSSEINSGPNNEGQLLVLEASLQQACYLEGNVLSTSGQNISGATIELLTTADSATTNLNGYYFTGTANSGTYQVVFSAAGYFPDTLTVNLSNGLLTVLNDTLVSMTPISISGEVIDVNGQGIPNAQLNFMNNNYSYSTYLTTASDGSFQIDSIYEGVFSVEVGAWGYLSSCENLSIFNNGSAITIMLDEGYYDDFTFDFGWTISGNASAGLWERGIPNGTSSQGSLVQTDSDVGTDCSTECYITGNSINASVGFDDVDDADVNLFSPLFDLTNYTNPEISYSWWFANLGGNGNPDDSLVISLSNGNIEEVLDVITSASTTLSQWVNATHTVSIPTTANMQLKLYTADYGSGHLVEAGFDKFQVNDLGIVIINDWECIAGSCVEVGGNTGSFMNEQDCLLSCLTTGLKDADEIHFYPNPTSGILNYNSNHLGLIKITNLLGEVLYSDMKNQSEIILNLNFLKPGFYLFETESEKIKFLKH